MKQIFKFSLIFSLLLWSGLVLAQESSLVTDPNIKVETQFLFPDAECTGPGELIYDDGTFENGYGWNNTVTDGRYVMLFTPPQYPWQFNTFCIALSRLATGPPSLTFDIVVYENNGGTPGNLIGSVNGVTATSIPVWTTLTWYDYVITSIPPLASGSVFIGAKWDASVLSGLVAIGADQSTTTTLQPGFSWANAGPWNPLTTSFPTYRAMGMRTLGSSGPPCPVGAPTNPSPADGAIDIPTTGNTASWTNGTGTTQVEVWFGEVGNLVQVYSGAEVSSLSLAGVEPLDYFTEYGWRVVCKNDTCGTQGPTWTFTTVQDPNLQVLFCDDFTAGSGNWTITNDGGTAGCIWEVFNPPFPNLYTLPPTSSGAVFAADVDDCGSGSTLLSTATLVAPIDATLYQTVWIEFDNDWNVLDAQDEAHVEVSTDGGTTWVSVWSQIGVDIRNTHENIVISSQVALTNFLVRFRSVQPGWDWWWAVDNVCIYGTDIIPVELTSFTANASNGLVELSWITATETNNQGFEVQRSSNGEFETIAFVDGHGTTTESQAYVYSDRNVKVGSYSYRLRQVDFDGTFEYSNVVEVDVPAPAVFALDQNYPNPFNPSTTINFRLAVDSKVSLKVFDVLGQEVARLVNGNLAAGSHQVDFNASALNSGVYLYKIEAIGTDGSNFTSVKKMILTK